MQRRNAWKPALALLGAIILSVPVLIVPAAAAPAPSRLDDELSQRLQSTPEAGLIPVIVEGVADASPGAQLSARAKRAEERVRDSGGRVVANSSLLGASVAELTPAQIRALAGDPSVGRIHFDAPVSASSFSADQSTGGPTPVVFQQTVGAPDAWQAGDTGQGVTVAVLDTGIDDDAAAFGGRIKARVDLVDPAHPAQGDPGGHGTHVAGIIAAGRTFPSPGVAPDASLVSVRVLDPNGHSRVSTIILGLEWVVAHKSSLGIRVVVMALGAPALAGYRDDPLASAAELAWRSGLVVVVAAGNNGPGAGTIQTPGIDPLVLTVGASDDAGTPSPADDVLPTWSSIGPTPDGVAKPDLVAPGRKIVSVRVPGSTIDLLSPTHVEGPSTIRLSGTSEAAGVAGGAAALLVQQRPELTPDQTKALLTHGARPIASVSAAAQGAGLLNVTRSLADRTPHVSRPHLPPANGLIRAVLPEIAGQIANSEVDGDKVLWDKVLWDKVLWDQALWDKVLWDKVLWDKVLWEQVLWDKVLWDKVLWDKVLWDQTTFD